MSTPIEQAFAELKKDLRYLEKRVAANSAALEKLQKSTLQKNKFDKQVSNFA